MIPNPSALLVISAGTDVKTLRVGSRLGSRIAEVTLEVQIFCDTHTVVGSDTQRFRANFQQSHCIHGDGTPLLDFARQNAAARQLSPCHHPLKEHPAWLFCEHAAPSPLKLQIAASAARKISFITSLDATVAVLCARWLNNGRTDGPIRLWLKVQNLKVAPDTKT